MSQNRGTSRLKYSKPRAHVLSDCMLLWLILVAELLAPEFVLAVVGNHRECCVTGQFLFLFVLNGEVTWRRARA
jgi:hypothetical protein